ncbi:hypothetical protein DESHY_10018 [Desulforamulus hydrothermalis Lam5 = DSM 18033]|uniref:Uncharacterized protein n=1 Tax=Desulforamulus hydrothermalis Lam5 = DSM 18033 TaxID=1121428 RepID=K8E604_9FIRM|nr:hypothetical protein DESHY_10018 [Desulforamulus hydrothermalis Lam5 = DSM 18033]
MTYTGPISWQSPGAGVGITVDHHKRNIPLPVSADQKRTFMPTPEISLKMALSCLL